MPWRFFLGFLQLANDSIDAAAQDVAFALLFLFAPDPRTPTSNNDEYHDESPTTRQQQQFELGAIHSAHGNRSERTQQ